MKMMHRFTVNGNGLFTWLWDDNNLDTIDQMRLGWIFEKDLPDPFPDASDRNPAPNFRSYFTDAGYRKFRKALKAIRKEVQKHGEIVKHEIVPYPDPELIVYQDNYQICVRDKEDHDLCMNESVTFTIHLEPSFESTAPKNILVPLVGS